MKLETIYKEIEAGISFRDLNIYLLKNREKLTRDDVLLILNKYELHLN